MRITRPVVILALLTAFTGPSKLAWAQSSIASLPDGNHRFCKRRLTPIDSPSVWEESVYCFRFHKLGARVVGDFYKSATSHAVCISGKVNGNTVTGHGLEYVFGRSGLFLYPYEGDVLVTRDINVFRRSSALSTDQGDDPLDSSSPLMVASGRVVKSGYIPDDPETREVWIRWDSALINLNSFEHYNAGSEIPPSSCKIH